MQTDTDPHSPLYIYNGPANLQELEGVNLTGARIFFNGSYSLRDLCNVNFTGATIFINGQQTSPPLLRSRSRPRQPSPERRHSDYYRPQDHLCRSGGEYPWLDRRLTQGGRERKRRRDEDASDRGSIDGLPRRSSFAADHASIMIPSLELAKHEPGRLSPYEDSGMKNSEKSTAIIANGGRITLTKLAPQSLDHQLPRFIEKRDFSLSPEVYAQTLQTENPQENRVKSGREAAGLSPTPIRQTAKRMRVDSNSDSGPSNKANSLASEELNLQLRKRVLANLGRNSRQEDAKIKQLSAERQQINSQLMQQSPGKGDACVSSLPLPSLPQESPLKNIITFARLEEEIVQTKVQYVMAEKQLRRERQTIGRASDGIIQRVKAIGKAIAELYEAREATQADRTRIDAFRRPAGNGKAQLPATPPITDAPTINLLSSGPVPGSEDREIRDWRAPGQRPPAKSTDIAANSTNPDISNPQVTFAPTDTDTFVRP